MVDVTPRYLVTDACTACGACLLTCPEHAILARLPLTVRVDRCTDCGECLEVCPADAIVRTPTVRTLTVGTSAIGTSVVSR